MIRRSGRLLKAAYLLRSVFVGLATYSRGVWTDHRRRRWLLPLVIVICALAMVTVLSITVEAVAPFVYAIL